MVLEHLLVRLGVGRRSRLHGALHQKRKKGAGLHQVCLGTAGKVLANLVVGQHVAQRLGVERLGMKSGGALLEKSLRTAPADRLHAFAGQFVPAAGIFGDRCRQRLRAQRRPAQRPLRAQDRAHPLVDATHDAAVGTGGQKPI